MTRALAALPGLALLTGCGVSVHVHARVTTVTSTSTSTQTRAAEQSFSSSGMALHFTYPGAFNPVAINSVSRKIESDKNVTRAALEVGTRGYDLLIVTRYANIHPPVTRANLAAQKPSYDRGFTRIFGRRMVASTGTIAGLPALFYADAPTPGVPVRATTRATFVFVGPDEYELQCQWTAGQRSAVLSACSQMHRTLHR
jgi:hypothetical protein